MRKIILACSTFLLLAASFASGGVIRRLVWQLETSDPVARNWPVTYGETFDMEVRYLDHTQPMDLAGGAVVLHCRTNGMAEGYSFQTTGCVTSARGWATVRVAVDALLPPGLAEASYVVAVTQGGTTNLLAAQGTLRLSGTSAGINGSPLPANEIADLAAHFLVVSNTAATALQPSATNNWEVGVHQAWITNETDTAALAAVSSLSQSVVSGFATNRTGKIWSDDGRQYIDGTGGVWKIEQTINLDPARMRFIFSDGATIGGDTPPAGITLAFGEAVETNGISYYWYANGIGVVRYPSGWARNINVSAPTNIPAIGPGTYGDCSNVYAFALEPVPYPRVAFVSDLSAPPLSAVVDAGGVATNPVTLTITNTAKYAGLTVTARGPNSMGIEAYSRGLAVLGKSTDGNGVSGTALGSGFGVTASGATGILAVASTSDVGIYTPNKIISGSGFVGSGAGITNIPAAGITGLVTYPSNYVAGFALPIPGTNSLYTLSVDSNKTLSVWEVLP